MNDLVEVLRSKSAHDPALRALLKSIDSGKANFRDTAQYSIRYSHQLGNILSENVLDIPPDVRETAAEELLKYGYDDMNTILAEVQKSLDEQAGIHIRPQKADFPSERVQHFAHSLIDPTVEDSIIKRRARSGSETITKSFHDSFIKKNAQFRNDAGLKCYITREGSNCCKWCSEVAGRYEFGSQPSDIFRRHDNCDCTIDYDGQKLRGKLNADGSRSKTWEEVPDADGSYEPKVLSVVDARAAEQRNLSQFRGVKVNSSSIDNGRGSGIINYARAIDSMFYADDYEFKSYTKEEIIENLKTSAVGLETIQYLEDNPQVKIKLSEDNERSDRGEHNKNLLTIWLNNCPNVRVAGQTVIHEVTHHRYGIGGSQQAETICFAFEKMHKENRKYLKQEEWDTLVELTKTVYWDLPAVGGVDNLERFDFIVKKG